MWYLVALIAGIAIGYLGTVFLDWIAGDDPRYKDVHPDYEEYMQLKVSGRLHLHVDKETP